MANTYSIIQTISVGSGGSTNIIFNSIPNTYTDLVLRCSLRMDTAGTSRAIALTFNGDTGANYSSKWWYISGATPGFVSSFGNSANSLYFGLAPGSSYGANYFAQANIYIPNYNVATAKTVSSEVSTTNSSSTAYGGFWSGLWTGTAAISSIELLGSQSFVQNSMVSLYGILKS